MMLRVRSPDEVAERFGVSCEALFAFIKASDRPRQVLAAAMFTTGDELRDAGAHDLDATPLGILPLFAAYRDTNVNGHDDRLLVHWSHVVAVRLDAASVRQAARATERRDQLQWLNRHAISLTKALAAADTSQFDWLWDHPRFRTLAEQNLHDLADELGHAWFASVNGFEPDRENMLATLEELMRRRRGQAGAKGSIELDLLQANLWKDYQLLTGKPGWSGAMPKDAWPLNAFARQILRSDDLPLFNRSTIDRITARGLLHDV